MIESTAKSKNALLSRDRLEAMREKRDRIQRVDHVITGNTVYH